MEPRHRDHAMTGDWKDHRDCHVKPDLVLIYRKPDAVDFHPELTRVFHRELTHLQIMFRGSGLGQGMAGLLHLPGCLA